MGIFNNSKKAKVVATANRAGNGLKRVKFTIGAGVVVALINSLGIDVPDELKTELANAITGLVVLGLDWLSYRKQKVNQNVQVETTEPDNPTGE